LSLFAAGRIGGWHTLDHVMWIGGDVSGLLIKIEGEWGITCDASNSPAVFPRPPAADTSDSRWVARMRGDGIRRLRLDPPPFDLSHFLSCYIDRLQN